MRLYPDQKQNDNLCATSRQYSIAQAPGFLFLISFLLFVLISFSVFANATPADNAERLEVFVRDGCPHCQQAKLYLASLKQEFPHISVEVRRVDQDQRALSELVAYSKKTGVWPPGVPTFVYDNQVLVGFESADITGPELSALIRRVSHARQSLETELFGTISVDRLGLPLFTLAIGLLDGFNPCAMWVLLFLLSLLVHLNDRKRMALIAGTFVLVSGLVYYAFMAAWLNLFLLTGLSPAIQLTLALLALMIGTINIKDYFRPGKGFSLSIPDAAKPGLYARMRNVMRAESLLLSLFGVAILAIVVNFIELLCTAGFPAIYTAVLTQQELSSLAHYGYLGLYIVGYIIDDSIMVFTAVIALSNQKLSERAGRQLKLISGTVMFVLGCVMLFRPEWLL